MIETACQRFDIDMSASWMIGDRASDIAAGKRAGLKTVLLESGYGTARLEYNVEYDYKLKDLRDLADIL